MITSETNTVVENSISKKISYLHSTQYEVDFYKEFRGNKVLQKELQEIHCSLEDLNSKAGLKTEEQKQYFRYLCTFSLIKSVVNNISCLSGMELGDSQFLIEQILNSKFFDQKSKFIKKAWQIYNGPRIKNTSDIYSLLEKLYNELSLGDFETSQLLNFIQLFYLNGYFKENTYLEDLYYSSVENKVSFVLDSQLTETDKEEGLFYSRMISWRKLSNNLIPASETKTEMVEKFISETIVAYCGYLTGLIPEGKALPVIIVGVRELNLFISKNQLLKEDFMTEDWVWEYNQTNCLDYIGLGNEYSLDELSRTDFDILKSIWLEDGGSKDSNYQHFAKYFKDE